MIQTSSFKTRTILIVISLFFLFNSSTPIQSEPNCDNPNQGDLQYCIDDITGKIDSLKPAHEANKKELTNLRNQASSIKNKIAAISNQLNTLADDIEEREEELEFTREIFEEKTNNHYKFIRLYDPLTPFLSSGDASRAFKEVSFRQKAADEDRKVMIEYADDLQKLKEDIVLLEASKISLDSAKKELDKKTDFLGGEVAKVEAYIASLSAKQQSFIAQKLGSLNLPSSLGAGPLFCTDDRNLNPGFSPAFAFYTFGIPHRVGMNQYGAYGRADSQSAEDILRAYFQNFDFSGGFEGRTVVVNGTNEFGQVFNNQTMNVEEYLKHLHEMPSSWPANALQAQAIAARSYALYEMNSKGYVKPSQSDQVIKKELNAQSWIDAVVATSGKVMVQGGQPIKAWYASTAGGYTYTSGDVWGGERSWTKRMRDTTAGVSGFSDLLNSSYDKSSPCFYAAQGWRNEYGKSAWLKSDEVADIANVILLAKADSSTRPHLYQIDKPNPEGVETWGHDRVRQELSARNVSPVTNATSVSINGVDWGVGRTTQVNINGVSFNGDEFKDFFNLRAPANIQIVGPLFNIERK